MGVIITIIIIIIMEGINMNLKQILFEGLSRDLEKKARRVMEKTVSQAESDGYRVTFTGTYRQATAISGSSEIAVPFVVAQTSDQISKREQGILEGRVYDMGKYAGLQGELKADSVEFTKRYQNGVMNRNPIEYSGKSTDGGNTYEGTWEFESSTADMAKKGTFIMEKKS